MCAMPSSAGVRMPSRGGSRPKLTAAGRHSPVQTRLKHARFPGQHGHIYAPAAAAGDRPDRGQRRPDTGRARRRRPSGHRRPGHRRQAARRTWRARLWQEARHRHRASRCSPGPGLSACHPRGNARRLMISYRNDDGAWLNGTEDHAWPCRPIRRDGRCDDARRAREDWWS